MCVASIVSKVATGVGERGGRRAVGEGWWSSMQLVEDEVTSTSPHRREADTKRTVPRGTLETRPKDARTSADRPSVGVEECVKWSHHQRPT